MWLVVPCAHSRPPCMPGVSCTQSALAQASELQVTHPCWCSNAIHAWPMWQAKRASAWLLRGRADVGAWHVRSCGQLRTGLQAWAGQIWLTLTHKPQTANPKPQTLKQQVHCRMECIAHRMVTDHSSGQALAAQQPAAHPLHTRHPTRTGRQAAGPCACSWKPGLGSRRPRGYGSHCRADLMWESLGGEIPPGRSHTPCMTQGSSRWIGRPK